MSGDGKLINSKKNFTNSASCIANKQTESAERNTMRKDNLEIIEVAKHSGEKLDRFVNLQLIALQEHCERLTGQKFRSADMDVLNNVSQSEDVAHLDIANMDFKKVKWNIIQLSRTPLEVLIASRENSSLVQRAIDQASCDLNDRSRKKGDN